MLFLEICKLTLELKSSGHLEKTLWSSFQCAGALTQALTQTRTWRHLNVFRFHPSHWVLKKHVMRTWRRFSILRISKPRLEKKAVKSLSLVSSEHGIEACTNCTSKALISSLGEEGTVKQWPIIKHSLPASFSRQGLNCEALTGLPWNSQCRPGRLWTQKSSCLCLWNAKIKGMCHQAYLLVSS